MSELKKKRNQASRTIESYAVCACLMATCVCGACAWDCYTGSNKSGRTSTAKQKTSSSRAADSANAGYHQ